MIDVKILSLYLTFLSLQLHDICTVLQRTKDYENKVNIYTPINNRYYILRKEWYPTSGFRTFDGHISNFRPKPQETGTQV